MELNFVGSDTHGGGGAIATHMDILNSTSMYVDAYKHSVIT